MTEKPHISPTQLDMLARCPEQWRRRYIEKEIIPPGIALLQGGAVHVGAETNFTQKVESYQDMPRTDIIDAAVAGFEERKAGGYSLTDEEQSRGATVVLGEATDQLVQLAGLHADSQAPDYQPIEGGVEAKSRVVVEGCSHDLLGVVDLIDDQRRVVDFKTASRSPSAGTADLSTQLTFYAAAHRILKGTDAAEVRLDTLVKTRKPKRHVEISHRDAADFAALSNRINAALALIKAGVFPPADPSAWWCSSKFCGYWKSCPYVNNGRKSDG